MNITVMKLCVNRKESMIHIKCKKCGWRLPFSSKGNEDTVKGRGDGTIVCPNCGEILIKRGGKGYEWRSTTRT